MKKVSKTDKSDPKRLKKDLPRLVRSLASEDCVMLIGASRCPWECEQKGKVLCNRSEINVGSGINVGLGRF